MYKQMFQNLWINNTSFPEINFYMCLKHFHRILTSSSSAMRDSRSAVGKTRGVKCICIVPGERGHGMIFSFVFSVNISPALPAMKS